MILAQRFFVAAVCTLGLLLGTSAVQAQNTKLLPADTEMIVSINLGQILRSDVLKKNELILNLVKGKIEEQLDDQDISKWLKKANFDLFRDLTSITIAVPGGDRKPEETFLVIEGNFDAAKIEAAALEASKEAKKDLRVTDIGKAKVFEVTPKEDKTLYIGILDKSTLVVSSNKSDVTEAIGRLAKGKKVAFKAEVVKSLLETVNNKQSINVIATSGLMTKIAEKAPQGGDKAKDAIEYLKKLDGFSGALTIDKDIDFRLGVNTKTDDSATQFAAIGNVLLKGAEAKLKEQAKKDEKFAPALDILKTLQINAQGSNLVFRGQISFDTLTEILKNLPLPNNQ